MQQDAKPVLKSVAIDPEQPKMETFAEDVAAFALSADGKQVFLRDYDNTATLASANGKEIDEDTDTMYHRAETTKIDVKKLWNDDNDRFQKRPESITVKLTGTAVIGTDEQSGEDITVTAYTAELTLTADDGWKGSFEHLPKYYVVTEGSSFDEPNAWYDITWTVAEVPIGENEATPLYVAEYSEQPVASGESVTITNTLPITKAEILVSKELTGRETCRAVIK